MKKIPLFTYGTIGDAEIFERLLQRPPQYQSARLKNYGLFVHPDNGYLFVKPQPSEIVAGHLIWIDHQELQLLDLWEDLPLYQRELLEIETNTESLKAFVYTQNDTKGDPPTPTTLNDRKQVFDDIDEFLASL